MAKPPAEAPPTTESTPDPDEPVRPGTSGTEVLLVNNRRRASTRLKDAQKKERDYKTKKRSAAARANYAEAKNHFKQGLSHNWAGTKLAWGVFTSLGYLLRDKNDRVKNDADEKRKLRAAEKQRKLEAQLKREKELAAAGAGAETDGEAA